MALTWASAFCRRLPILLRTTCYLNNGVRGLLIPFFLRCKSDLKLNYSGSKGWGRVISLCILFQRVRNCFLLLEFSQLLLKSETPLLYSFTLHLPCVLFLGSITINQEVSSANNDHREYKRGSIHVVGDLRDEIHLIFLRDILHEWNILHRHHYDNFLRSASKSWVKNGGHPQEGVISPEASSP